MFIIYIITIIVLLTIWYCPAFLLSVEHYVPHKQNGGIQQQPLFKHTAKGRRNLSKNTLPTKGPTDGTLTPDTVINLPLGLLIQFLDKMGVGNIG